MSRNKPIYVKRASMPTYEEYIKEIKPLWESHILTNMGTLHNKLEEQLKDYLNAPMLSLLVNGHASLEITLEALNLSGEVITTPYTFASTTHAIVRNRLTPVFCDIRQDDFTIDVDKIEALITEQTTAIVPVHVYGNICEMEKIDAIAKLHNLKVIYDAAHAFGEKINGKEVGCFGDASVFSFHATKSFHTIEGGAVVTNDKILHKRINRLKNFGVHDEITIDEIGTNAKMNEFQAAMGICNLRHLDENILFRKQRYEQYKNRLSNIVGIQFFDVDRDNKLQSNYSYLPIVIHEEIFGCSRDDVYQYLRLHNILTRKYYYPLTSELQCYAGTFHSDCTPIAKNLSMKILTLPLYEELTYEDVEEICDLIHMAATQ